MAKFASDPAGQLARRAVGLLVSVGLAKMYWTQEPEYEQLGPTGVILGATN